MNRIEFDVTPKMNFRSLNSVHFDPETVSCKNSRATETADPSDSNSASELRAVEHLRFRETLTDLYPGRSRHKPRFFFGFSDG